MPPPRVQPMQMRYPKSPRRLFQQKIPETAVAPPRAQVSLPMPIYPILSIQQQIYQQAISEISKY